MDNQEKMYWAALQVCIHEELLPIVREIIGRYGSVEAFWMAKDNAPLHRLSEAAREKLILARKSMNPARMWDVCMEKGVAVISCLDTDYPREMLFFSHSPLILFCYGHLDLLNMPSAGVVGSRKCTAYGRKMAEDFSSAFVRAGYCVVSGMAKGIDAAAHEGALNAKGYTVAVLGSGVDVPYPVENRCLYQRIKEEGLVVSEFPPGDKPLPWHFPLRNRIISGLSRFVFLAEGEARSGALITCGWAAEQGKDVWALPGPVTNPQSIGPLQMIKDGAYLALTPNDILSAYPPLASDRQHSGIREEGRHKDTPGHSLSARERSLYSGISYYPVHIDALLAQHAAAGSGKAGISGNLYLDLTKLLTLRLIEKLPGDYYQRI